MSACACLPSPPPSPARRPGADGRRRFKHTLYGTAVFCCFLTWWIVYIAQINTEIFIAPSNPFTNLTFLNVSKDL